MTRVTPFDDSVQREFQLVCYPNSHSVMAKSLDFALCGIRRLGQISHKGEERIRLANEQSHGR